MIKNSSQLLIDWPVLGKIVYYVESHRYYYLYKRKGPEKSRTDETYIFIHDNNFRHEDLLELVKKLRPTDCTSKERDDIPEYDNGDVYKFKTEKFGEWIYLKIKVPDKYDSNQVIMSVHKWDE